MTRHAFNVKNILWTFAGSLKVLGSLQKQALTNKNLLLRFTSAVVHGNFPYQVRETEEREGDGDSGARACETMTVLTVISLS